MDASIDAASQIGTSMDFMGMYYVYHLQGNNL